MTANPISKLAIAQILFNRTQFHEFINSNKIDLEKANWLGRKLSNCDNDYEVRFLIKRDANINVKDKHGKAALMYAADRGYNSIVQILIDAGANLNYGLMMTRALKNRDYSSILVLVATKPKLLLQKNQNNISFLELAYGLYGKDLDFLSFIEKAISQHYITSNDISLVKESIKWKNQQDIAQMALDYETL